MFSINPNPYILKVIENDCIGTSEKTRAFIAIRQTMLDESVFSRALSVKQRMDDYCILRFLKSGRIAMSRFRISAVDRTKAVLRCVHRLLSYSRYDCSKYASRRMP